MTYNRYGGTLIQDTADFFYYFNAIILHVLAMRSDCVTIVNADELQRTDMTYAAQIESLPSFHRWMFGHLIETVYGIPCKGHCRRQHPHHVIVDLMQKVASGNGLDLHKVFAATIKVPKIYDDQVLDVDLWYDDLVIRYNQTLPQWRHSLRDIIPHDVLYPKIASPNI
jgi:hypothetical protein